MGLVGETVGEVEPFLSKTFDRKRMYMETKGSVLKEVPYLEAPEESDEGVPEHFMVRLMDGRNEMTVDEVSDIFRRTHAESTRSEYFTLAHLQNEGVDGVKTEGDAGKYHEKYKKIVKKVDKKIEKSLKQARAGRILLLAPRKEKS